MVHSYMSILNLANSNLHYSELYQEKKKRIIYDPQFILSVISTLYFFWVKKQSYIAVSSI